MAPRDLQWTTRVYPRYRGTLSDRRWRSFLDELFGLKQTSVLGLDLEQLRKEAEVMKKDALELFGVLMTAYAERLGRPRWGVKTPLLELYAEQLLNRYPQARILHVVRDPRDMCSSILRRGFYGPIRRGITDSVAWMTMNWKQSARIAARFDARDPQRYRIVHYEEFVRNPEDSSNSICEFIGEEYDANMISMSDFAEFRDKGGNSSFGPLNGISPAPIGRFLENMRPAKIRICELLAGSDLMRQGYELSNVSIKLKERLRLIITESPIATLQIMLRAVLQIARIILPRKFERRPLPLVGES
jgi:hypothetical protein